MTCALGGRQIWRNYDENVNTEKSSIVPGLTIIFKDVLYKWANHDILPKFWYVLVGSRRHPKTKKNMWVTSLVQDLLRGKVLVTFGDFLYFPGILLRFYDFGGVTFNKKCTTPFWSNICIFCVCIPESKGFVGTIS